MIFPALTRCEVTGLPHEIIERDGELCCMDCRKPYAECCEDDGKA